MAPLPLPDIDLSGLSIVLTGADRGLGKSMAEALGQRGANLTLASPAQGALEAVADGINGRGPGRAIVQATDITDLAACEACRDAAVAAFGTVDILINNARRLHRGPDLPEQGNALPFWQSDPRIYRQTVDVNVTGTFFMSRTIAPIMIAKGRGKIINLTTSLRNFFGPRNSPYGVTKAAVDSQTCIWASDLEATGVTCNALLPGGSCDSDPDKQPVPGRVLLPVDVMNPLLVWLCSPRSDGLTGQRFKGSLWKADQAESNLDDAARACIEPRAFRED